MPQSPSIAKEIAKLRSKWRNASLGYKKAEQNGDDSELIRYRNKRNEIEEQLKNLGKTKPKTPVLVQGLKPKRDLTDDEKDYRAARRAFLRNMKKSKDTTKTTVERNEYKTYAEENKKEFEGLKKNLPKRSRALKPCSNGYSRINGRCVRGSMQDRLRSVRNKIRLNRARYALARKDLTAGYYLDQLENAKAQYYKLGGDLTSLSKVSPTARRYLN